MTILQSKIILKGLEKMSGRISDCPKCHKEEYLNILLFKCDNKENMYYLYCERCSIPFVIKFTKKTRNYEVIDIMKSKSSEKDKLENLASDLDAFAVGYMSTFTDMEYVILKKAINLIKRVYNQ